MHFIAPCTITLLVEGLVGLLGISALTLITVPPAEMTALSASAKPPFAIGQTSRQLRLQSPYARGEQGTGQPTGHAQGRRLCSWRTAGRCPRVGADLLSFGSRVFCGGLAPASGGRLAGGAAGCRYRPRGRWRLRGEADAREESNGQHLPRNRKRGLVCETDPESELRRPSVRLSWLIVRQREQDISSGRSLGRFEPVR
jgi:hypothetical protein